MSNTIQNNSIDQVDSHIQTLYPNPKVAYHIDVFTTFDPSYIDLTGSYHRSNDGSWRGNSIVKVIEVFAKFFILVVINLLKIPIALSLVIPLSLKLISICINKKNALMNQSFREKAIAFAKASEEHAYLGNLVHAQKNQTNQSQVARINCTQIDAIQYNVEKAHIEATTSQNLLDTSQQWAAVLQDKASQLPADTKKEEILNLFRVAVQDLAVQGSPIRMELNKNNASLAAAEAFKNTMIHNLRVNGGLTKDYIDYIVDSYLNFMPHIREDFAKQIRHQITTEILSDPEIQSTALRHKKALLDKISDLRNLTKIQESINTRLCTQEKLFTSLTNERLQIQEDLQNTICALDKEQKLLNNQSSVSAHDSKEILERITQHVDTLFGVRDHNHKTRKVTQEYDIQTIRGSLKIGQTNTSKDVTLSMNQTGQIINRGLLAHDNQLNNQMNLVLEHYESISLSLMKEVTKCNEQSNKLEIEMQSLMELFQSQEEFDKKMLRIHPIDQEIVIKSSCRSEYQKLEALKNALVQQNKPLYESILLKQMGELEQVNFYKEIALQYQSDNARNSPLLNLSTIINQLLNLNQTSNAEETALLHMNYRGNAFEDVTPETNTETDHPLDDAEITLGYTVAMPKSIFEDVTPEERETLIVFLMMTISFRQNSLATE